MSRSRHVNPSTASTPSTVAGRYSPSGPRVLAIAFGAILTGSYLRVFYHVADVAGGVRWLVLAVGAALVLATAAAWLTTARNGTIAGGLLVLAGVSVYVALVPAIQDELLSVTFARRWLRYLTGISVLGFRRVDLWAIVVAPGPAFLSWLLLLRRRYEGAALVGGLMLGFFAMTGDAGGTTTLVGMTSLLGLLGVGTVEREAGAWREVTRVGFVVAIAAIVARWFRVVPETGALASGGLGGGESRAPTGHSLEGDLENADERAHIHESISLSPTVLFTVEADAGSYWHVAAYDRYTGGDWIRTGDARPYGGSLDPPPGEPTRNEQTVVAERDVGTLPAVWKPTSVDGIDPDRVRVTDLEGLAPVGRLEPGDEYRVTSESPSQRRNPGRDAGPEPGSAYPADVRDRYLQLPESTSDRVGQLAEEIVGDGGAETPYDAAVAIRRWLTVNKSYGVAVDRPDGDVVESFLFSMERGYCVYFASAMVVMLRTLDVPARFVLGYATGQPVGGGRWVVRGLDSHAWVEVYRPGIGWTRFDPTPGNFRAVVRQSILASARQRGTAGVDTNESRRAGTANEASRLGAYGVDDPEAGNLTNASVDPGNSTDAGLRSGAADEDASPAGSRADSSTRVGDEPVVRWLAERDRLDLLTGAVGVALGLHWTGALQRGYRSARLRWQRPTGSPHRDVVLAYERLELLIAGRFRSRRPDETRRGYLEAAEWIVDDERARRVVDLYEQASYAGDVDRSDATEAIRLVDELVADGD